MWTKVSHQAVILLRERNPELTLQEIGIQAVREGGWGEPITRERVRQILVIAKKPTVSSGRYARCERCDASSQETQLHQTSTSRQGKSIRIYLCETCREKVRRARKKSAIKKRCPLCHGKFIVPWWKRKQKYCSGACRSRNANRQKTLYALEKWQKIFRRYPGLTPWRLAKKLHRLPSVVSRAWRAFRAPQ